MIQFFENKSTLREKKNSLFSILIPSWNNLAYLRFCVESILKNSNYKHQIIIHVNDGSDGTKKWVEEQGFDYSWSENNVGVCYAFNAASSLAKSKYLVLLDDDNYLLPDWDLFIWEEIQSLGHPYYAISATKIEYKKTFNQCVIAPYDFGQSLESFREQDLLSAYKSLQKEDWYGSSWYPMAVHKHVWDQIGGLSVEFTPGMYSDPDFMMKLWHAGVRYFKGLGQSRSYHFMSRSVSRVKKNNGRKQFLVKWRISNSVFRQYYLKLGQPFNGEVDEPKIPWYLKIKDRVKLFFSI